MYICIYIINIKIAVFPLKKNSTTATAFRIKVSLDDLSESNYTSNIYTQRFLNKIILNQIFYQTVYYYRSNCKVTTTYYYIFVYM